MAAHDFKKSIRVSNDGEFPTTCISCGMYADQFVTVKAVEIHTVLVEGKVNDDPAGGLGCLLFFLGPIGVLISLVMQLNAKKKSGSPLTKSKNVTVKQKVKVPQCSLCQSQGKLTANSVQNGLFEFDAHSKFISSYHIINREQTDQI